MNPNPRVSVVVPSFNRASVSVRAINSILIQTYPNVELVFVNDGSTEDYSGIESLLRESGANYFRTPHSGVSSARNFGLQHCTGELVAFLDSDDEWLEGKLSRQVDTILKNPEIAVVQTLEKWIRNGKELNVPERLKPAHGESFHKAIEYCCISPSSVLLRKDVFNEVGYFDTLLRVCEDYDLWLRVLDRYPVHCIQEVLTVKYGGHSDQLSRSEEAMDRFRVYALIKYLNTARDTVKIQAVIEAINSKLQILEKGAEKRDLISDVQVYREMKNSLQLYLFNSKENPECLMRLTESILSSTLDNMRNVQYDGGPR